MHVRYVRLAVLSAVAAVAAGCGGGQRTSGAGALRAGTAADGLVVRAEARVARGRPATVLATLSLTNPGRSPVDTTTGGDCQLMLRVYRSAVRTGRPAWN